MAPLRGGPKPDLYVFCRGRTQLGTAASLSTAGHPVLRWSCIPLGRSLMRSRNWSIRSKIIALVAVPVLTLLAQWIFVTALNAGPAFNLLSAQTLLSDVAKPGKSLLGGLQRERRLTVEFLSAPDAS